MNVQPYTQSLDDMFTDTIVVGFFSDELPPKDLTGLLDWRMSGFLSRQLQNNTLTGAFGEVTLIPINKKIPARRVLLLGLGEKKGFTTFQALKIGHTLARQIDLLKTTDLSIRIPNACDESRPMETQNKVIEMLKNQALHEHLFVRSVDPKVVEWL